MNKKFTAMIIAALWAVLTLTAWFSPAREASDAERRPLAQLPEISAKNLLSGSFMEDFEDYTLDQFPLRDTFRGIKSIFHYYGLGQKDNNGIYIADGSAAKQEYPLVSHSIDHILERMDNIYRKHLEQTGSHVYFAIVPDKGYYLAEEAGQLRLDYEALYARMREGTPWASFVDLRDMLSAEDYYRTDTHWRQERLLGAAGALCEALGVTEPKMEDYTVTELEKPFYGVYYGQAALPMAADSISLLESDLLRNCTVYDHESGKTTAVYDMTMLDSKDLYNVYLSGPKALLTIENPNASTDRELIIFRDSFGSSIAPLLVADYAKVTLVDLRYIRSDLLEQFLSFEGQDVLFLYSTLIINSSASIK